MATTCTIYGLFTSEDVVIRYIGQTTASINRRLREHVTAAQNLANDAPVQRWIRKRMAQGCAIQIIALEENAELDAAEIRWIAYLKATTKDCLNINPGGDAGARGVTRSEATKQRMRKPKSDATRQKMMKPKGEETRKKMSLAQIGNTKSRGSSNRNAKLSADDVVTIKQRISQGDGICAIAKEYGVQKSCISKIKHGRSWSHI